MIYITKWRESSVVLDVLGLFFTTSLRHRECPKYSKSIVCIQARKKRIWREELGDGELQIPYFWWLSSEKKNDRPKDLREKWEDQSISRFLPQMFLFILSLIVVKGAKQFEWQSYRSPPTHTYTHILASTIIRDVYLFHIN